jgi:ribonuclease J
MDHNNVLLAQTGNVIEISGKSIKVVDQAVSGRIFVDGLGVGDVGSIVLRDRRHLAQDGLIIVAVTIETETMTVAAGPDIVSRGFVYVRESEELMREAREILEKTINKCLGRGICEWNFIKGQVKESLSDYIFFRTKRKPMILPIIMEI